VIAVPPDLSKAELRDFTLPGGDPEFRLTLSDGSIMAVKPIVQSVLLIGSDPLTGLPIYNIQIAPAIRLVAAGPGTRKDVRAAKPNPPGFG